MDPETRTLTAAGQDSIGALGLAIVPFLVIIGSTGGFGRCLFFAFGGGVEAEGMALAFRGRKAAKISSNSSFPSGSVGGTGGTKWENGACGAVGSKVGTNDEDCALGGDVGWSASSCGFSFEGSEGSEVV